MFDNQLSQFPSVFTHSLISILNPVLFVYPIASSNHGYKAHCHAWFFKYGVIRRIGEEDKLHCTLQAQRVIFEFGQTSTPSSSLSTGTCYVARVGFLCLPYRQPPSVGESHHSILYQIGVSTLQGLLM